MGPQGPAKSQDGRTRAHVPSRQLLDGERVSRWGGGQWGRNAGLRRGCPGARGLPPAATGPSAAPPQRRCATVLVALPNTDVSAPGSLGQAARGLPQESRLKTDAEVITAHRRGAGGGRNPASESRRLCPAPPQLGPSRVAGSEVGGDARVSGEGPAGFGVFRGRAGSAPQPCRRPGCTWATQGPRRLRTGCVGGRPSPPSHPTRPPRGTQGCPDVSANNWKAVTFKKVLIYVTPMAKQTPSTPQTGLAGFTLPSGEELTVPRLEGGPSDGGRTCAGRVQGWRAAGEGPATLSSCLGDRAAETEHMVPGNPLLNPLPLPGVPSAPGRPELPAAQAWGVSSGHGAPASKTTLSELASTASPAPPNPAHPAFRGAWATWSSSSVLGPRHGSGVRCSEAFMKSVQTSFSYFLKRKLQTFRLLEFHDSGPIGEKASCQMADPKYLGRKSSAWPFRGGEEGERLTGLRPTGQRGRAGAGRPRL